MSNLPCKNTMHLCLQRGQQRFFRQFLMVCRRFCSVPFAFRRSLKPVFPCVPRLSVAVYVVRMIVAIKETLNMNRKTLCSSFAFRLCISPSLPISFYRLLAFNSVLCGCQNPNKKLNGGKNMTSTKKRVAVVLTVAILAAVLTIPATATAALVWRITWRYGRR